ncbi:acylase [Rhodoferax saidenbachensis]|uniref:Penicillin amidase n=1 Tax=Rhodoferax saidenbachensis TaxID=1484693 RepID=A0A1P8KC04_9BURK|nr:acylase [Rhodoferax saidenbachensis]APW43534.1 penicillin amidase [Rhodoferax saidenbachensis]
MRRVGRWLGYGVLILLLAATGVVVADRWDQPAQPDPKVFVDKAAQYHARIQRSALGVPHITGPKDVDVAFGLAYAHAEDDFATIQEVLLATRGTLAASKGPAAATTDYLVRLMGIWPAIAAGYERDLPQDVRDVLQAYADGLNYYAAIHPYAPVRGALPITGRDIAAGFAFKAPFFYGLDKELKRLTAPTAPAKTAAADDEKPPIGSNAIAVAPSRSADGATRLLVNSHQPYTGPVAWYEAVLDSGEGWHVAGGFFPGAPFLLHGHNEHLGWAATVNQPDLIDIYKLTINPANDNQYQLDGVWKDFEISDAALRVKLLGPLAWTFHRPLLRSAHGPVLRTDNGVFAIRFAGMGEIAQPLQYFRQNKARNFDEWRAALALHTLPSINYVYADAKGHIGYIYNGRYPNRKEGVDWKADLPGDRSDLIWKDYLPFAKTPQIWDPKSGFVFNSNNTPFHATGAEDALQPANFSPTMGIETRMNNRAYRVEETFGADRAITAEAFRRYKYDVQYSDRSETVALVRKLVALDPQGDSALQQAQVLLKGWNQRADQANRSAALVLLTAQNVISLNGEAVVAPLAGLRKAMDTLQTHFGRLDPTWGEVNRIRRGAVDLGIDGGRDTYRSVWGNLGTDGRLNAVAGDTFIMFVTWDKQGQLSSESVHQFGSATLDAQSPHFADQTPLFVAMQTKPVLFTEAQRRGKMREDYVPGQRTLAGSTHSLIP